MGLINKAFGWLLRWCYLLAEKIDFFQLGEYAVALLLFTIVCQIILFPFSIKQQKNSQKQASLRPKENVIRRRYNGRTDRNSQMKLNEEIQNLYAEEHYSPFAGCLPLLIQLPLIFALFAVIRQPLTYVTMLDKNVIAEMWQHHVDAGAVVAREGSKYIDEIKILSFIKSPEYGAALNEIAAGLDVNLAEELLPNYQFTRFINLADMPIHAFSKEYNVGWAIVLIPVATFLSSFFGQKITRKYTYQAPSAESASSMKLMNIMMPLFSTYITFTYAASFGLYWTLRSVFSVIQQIFLSKILPIPQFTEEELKAEEKAYFNKIKHKGASTYKPSQEELSKRKSLIFDDDEEVVEMPQNAHSIVDGDDDTASSDKSELIDKAPLKDDEK